MSQIAFRCIGMIMLVEEGEENNRLRSQTFLEKEKNQRRKLMSKIEMQEIFRLKKSLILSQN